MRDICPVGIHIEPFMQFPIFLLNTSYPRALRRMNVTQEAVAQIVTYFFSS